MTVYSCYPSCQVLWFRCLQLMEKRNVFVSEKDDLGEGDEHIPCFSGQFNVKAGFKVRLCLDCGGSSCHECHWFFHFVFCSLRRETEFLKQPFLCWDWLNWHLRQSQWQWGFFWQEQENKLKRCLQIPFWSYHWAIRITRDWNMPRTFLSYGRRRRWFWTWQSLQDQVSQPLCSRCLRVTMRCQK